MPAQSTALNTDTNAVQTSAQYGDRGDGTNDWFLRTRISDGGNTTQGLKADAAVTDPSASGSIVALLKGLLSTSRLSLPVTSATATSNSTAMGAASGVVKASAGKLYTVTVTNDNAAARWIQFYNSTTVPADTAVPVLSVKLAAGASMQLSWGTIGRNFTTGIAWANSTTGPTKTIGSADTEMDVQFL